MELANSYDLRIPKDSLTEIDTAGLLGGSLESIDVSQASGSPIENYGYLKSKPTNPPLSVEDLIKALNAATIEASKAAEKMFKSTTGFHSRGAKP